MSVSKFYKHPVPVLIIGAVIISFSGVFVKTSLVHPLVSAFYRVFFGCLFLICACWIKKEFKRKRLKKNLAAILCGLVVHDPLAPPTARGVAEKTLTGPAA